MAPSSQELEPPAKPVRFTLLYGLPMMLGAWLQFPCVVQRIAGKTSGCEFGYETFPLSMAIALMQPEDQDFRVRRSLCALSLLGQSGQRRLHAGLEYLYRAARLLDAGHTTWEFMAEVVLNLAKVLESLFPPEGSQKTRDAARRGLAVCGFSHDEIETWFLPALALRSELDVAHVKLAVLNRDQTETLTVYVENALAGRFRVLLTGVVEASLDGRSPLSQYVPRPTEPTALDAISKIQERMRAAGVIPGGPTSAST